MLGSVQRLEDLFFRSHLQEAAWKKPREVIKLVLWFPFGIICVVIRFLLLWPLFLFCFVATSFRVTHIIFRPSVVRVLLVLFGLYCRYRNVNLIKKEKKPFIVASNHRTAFDIFPLFPLCAPLAVIIDREFFDGHCISRFVTSVLNKSNVMEAIKIDVPKNGEQRERQRQQIVRHLDKETSKTLVFFPEGWDTNGKGLLLYQKFLFSVGLPIVPLALKVHVPLLPVVPGMLGSTILKEIFWLFFVPCYVYDITVLPSQSALNNEDAVDFARRVQQLTADTLKIPATSWSKKEVLHYRKLLMHSTNYTNAHQ
jgi:1-acyl-sn-glycerol-3-phosphate acyltransferase